MSTLDHTDYSGRSGYSDHADRDLPPLPTIGQMPRVTRVDMYYFDDEDVWRMALFAGKEMLGAHFESPATDGRRLEMIFRAFARILHQQAAARQETSSPPLDDDVTIG